MKNIVSIGEVLMDVYSENNTIKSEVGGASFNVACSIGALKQNNSYFMGSLGNDEFVSPIKDFVKKFNVKEDFIQESDKPTTIAKVTLDENKERFFQFIRNSDAEYSLSKESNEKLSKIDFIHFGSATGFLEGNLKESYNELFEFAIKNNIKFSFDPNFRDKLWVTDQEIKNFKNHCQKFMDKASLIKFSEDELLLLTEIGNQEEAVRTIMQRNPNALVCITRGCEDTIFGWKNQINYVPTILAEHLVDTTGAGDAFISNLISEYVSIDVDANFSTEEITKIIKKSNMFANQTVQYLGALSFLEHLN
ncbi:fructokinase [Mesoplasma florum L1]|uniref:Fructokinase n=1 Tax=Mesoplasma florum (strain ATCC 33453 / NBRC 100688 / NCTC 11704 / L1) TaxID=265311 RepID=Q6F0V1_MESFL|nr:carbohydrate kinase [Mesoplasma florum]AAT75872.1 fructokinase [Mesoplasma florum L1]AVN61177.1 carbohydrate kinase [Mesoplasma florum]